MKKRKINRTDTSLILGDAQACLDGERADIAYAKTEQKIVNYTAVAILCVVIIGVFYVYWQRQHQVEWHVDLAKRMTDAKQNAEIELGYRQDGVVMWRMKDLPKPTSPKLNYFNLDPYIPTTQP